MEKYLVLCAGVVSVSLNLSGLAVRKEIQLSAADPFGDACAVPFCLFAHGVHEWIRMIKVTLCMVVLRAFKHACDKVGRGDTGRARHLQPSSVR